MCGNLEMFSILFLTNVEHRLNQMVVFLWSGEGLN